MNSDFEPYYIRIILLDNEDARQKELIDGLTELGFVIEKIRGVLTITDRLDSGEGIYEAERVSYYKQMTPDAKTKSKASRREQASEKRWQK